MESKPYTNATVMIFDDKLHARKQTRSILNILGFWKIEECETHEDARIALGGVVLIWPYSLLFPRRTAFLNWSTMCAVSVAVMTPSCPSF